MDLIEAIENIQDEEYSFMHNLTLVPNNEEEHDLFINFCIDKGITLVSGKSPKEVPYHEHSWKRYSFSFIKTIYGIRLGYDTRDLGTRKRIMVKEFLDICKIKGLYQ